MVDYVTAAFQGLLIVGGSEQLIGLKVRFGLLHLRRDDVCHFPSAAINALACPTLAGEWTVARHLGQKPNWKSGASTVQSAIHS